jgi:hypothetical protein
VLRHSPDGGCGVRGGYPLLLALITSVSHEISWFALVNVSELAFDSISLSLASFTLRSSTMEIYISIIALSLLFLIVIGFTVHGFIEGNWEDFALASVMLTVIFVVISGGVS